MGVFGHFKKSEPELSNIEKRLNQMWALWAEGHADSSWRKLMTYQGEINNGGHDRYFLNTGNTGDLQKEMAILETVLPEKLQSNLRKAYAAYRALSEKESDGWAQAILEQCDVVKQHHTLMQILMGLLNTGFKLLAAEEAQPLVEMLDIFGMRDGLRRPMLMIKAFAGK